MKREGDRTFLQVIKEKDLISSIDNEQTWANKSKQNLWEALQLLRFTPFHENTCKLQLHSESESLCCGSNSTECWVEMGEQMENWFLTFDTAVCGVQFWASVKSMKMFGDKHWRNHSEGLWTISIFCLNPSGSQRNLLQFPWSEKVAVFFHSGVFVETIGRTAGPFTNQNKVDRLTTSHWNFLG